MSSHFLSHNFKQIIIFLFVFHVFYFFSQHKLLETVFIKYKNIPNQNAVQQLEQVSTNMPILMNQNNNTDEQVLQKNNVNPERNKENQQQLLKNYLKNNYFVEEALASEVVKSVFLFGEKYNIDPILLLAVIKVESMFNPNAVSTAKATGLMQVLPSAHPEKIAAIGGTTKLFVPHINIEIGSQILREYLNRTGCVVSKALQLYNGAKFDLKQKYTKKVLMAKQEFMNISTF